MCAMLELLSTVRRPFKCHGSSTAGGGGLKVLTRQARGGTKPFPGQSLAAQEKTVREERTNCSHEMRSLDFDRRRYQWSVTTMGHRVVEPPRSLEGAEHILGCRALANGGVRRETVERHVFWRLARRTRNLVRPHSRCPRKHGTSVVPMLFRTDTWSVPLPSPSVSSVLSIRSPSTCSTSISPLTLLRYLYPLSRTANLCPPLSAAPTL